MKEVDFVLMVTEPTPFGLYDLQLAREAFLPLGKPMGIVINRAGLGEEKVYAFCRSSGVPIWAEIPYDRQIAVAYSKSQIVATVSAQLMAIFMDLADKINQAAVITRKECHA